MNIYEKLELLKNHLKPLESAAVTFSGGVDSSFLLKVAHGGLGNNVLTVTARSSTYPGRELKEAVEFANFYGINQNEVSEEEFLKVLDMEVKQKINMEFKNIGFLYSALDLKGYRTGSMNEGIEEIIK
jgi:PP-loop superfamily ATP-utilizing enzyme